MSRTLASQLKQASGARARAALDKLDPPALETSLRALFDRGRRAVPGVKLAAEDFVAALAAQLPDQAPAAALQGLHAEDFYLAAAASRGDPDAIAELDRRFIAEVPRY